jgi:hypothetical protein
MEPTDCKKALFHHRIRQGRGDLHGEVLTRPPFAECHGSHGPDNRHRADIGFIVVVRNATGITKDRPLLGLVRV